MCVCMCVWIMQQVYILMCAFMWLSGQWLLNNMKIHISDSAELRFSHTVL